MIKLVVFNQYNEGPLWYIDEGGCFHDVKKDDLKKDEIILDLTSKMNKKYITIYDTIYNCEDKYQDEKIEKQKETYGLEMLDLVNKLKKHLNEINDGSYEVIDYETAIINIQYLSKKENKNQQIKFIWFYLVTFMSKFLFGVTTILMTIQKYQNL